MTVAPSLLHRFAAPALAAFVSTALLAATGAEPAAEATPAPRTASRTPTVPPVPDGTPADLVAYIDKLADPAAMPTSRGRRRYYLRRAAAATVEATDKILAQTQPDDDLHQRAVALKLDALETLRQFGEPQAAAALAGFAESLDHVSDPALAARVRGAALAAQVDTAVGSGRPEDAAPLVARVAALLEAAPDDADLATTAADFAVKLGGMPGGESAAAAAFTAFLPQFERSGNPAVRELADRIGGTARRLSLPGNPMKITGTLLSGEPFDQNSLEGKVVLVDFWATWCGPCVAEITNLRKQYEQWHDKGFEVVGVSLEEDHDELAQFVKAKGIPWPVLYEEPGGPGWRHPLATYYGITGIPTVVLIGRDGNVVTLDARGKKLGAALERLLGEPAERLGDRRP
ncbi:MAG: TlpA family protein disulfide reductase [Planctomycetota bacterium]